MQATKHIMFECPNCQSRYVDPTPTLGPSRIRGRMTLTRIAPICERCFEKCPAGHSFGYGERCQVCKVPRRRFNLEVREIDPDDPTIGKTSTGTPYPKGGKILGDDTPSGTTDAGATGSTNVLRAYKFTARASASIDSLWVRVGNVGTGYTCYASCCLYSDSSGYPGSKLGSDSNIINVQGPNGWVKFTFASPISLTAGTVYWLNTNFYVSGTGIGQIHYVTGSANQKYRISGSYGGSSPSSPATFPGSATGAAEQGLIIAFDNANGYPNADYGTNTGTTNSGSTNTWDVYKVTLSVPVVMMYLTYYISGGTGFRYNRLAIWADNGSGYPGALVKDFGETGSQWTGVTLNSIRCPATYMAAGDYWFGFNVPSTNWGYIANDAASTGTRVTRSVTYGAAPDPFGAGGTTINNTYHLRIFVTGYGTKSQAKAMKAILSESGIFSSISFWAGEAGNYRLAIYNDSSGPNTLQWELGSTAVSGAPAWQTKNISDGTPTSLSLSAGTYHLAWQIDTENYVPSYTTGSAGDGNYRVMAYGSFPATWTSGVPSSEIWSIYASYTTTGAVVTGFRVEGRDFEETKF